MHFDVFYVYIWIAKDTTSDREVNIPKESLNDNKQRVEDDVDFLYFLLFKES